MRERLDCAVLTTRCTHDTVRHWFDGRTDTGRLHLSALGLELDAAEPQSYTLLANACMPLRRFDACLITVSQSNLAWVRRGLSAADGRLHTPIIVLSSQLKATALADLYALGLADFVRGPVCMEELRVRVERVLDKPRYRSANAIPPPSVSEPAEGYGDMPDGVCKTATDVAEDALCATILDRTGIELDAFAAAAASRLATSRESFKVAKGRVVERFERAYITAALGRHGGNIAMAARAAQKHRRAFWALMQKHKIDATPYRGECPARRTAPKQP